MHAPASLRIYGAVTIAASLTLSAPLAAHACSIANGIWSADPASQAPLAEGSRIYVGGFFGPEEISVDVDGEPAALVLDDAFPRSDYYGAYTVEPAPALGAVVTLRSCPADAPDWCEGADSWSWTVGERDTQPPAAAMDLEFGTYDHRDVDTSASSCSNGEVFDVSIYAHVSVAAEDGAGTSRYALLEVLDASTDEALAHQVLPVEPTGGELDARLIFEAGVLGAPLREAACLQVTLLDLAGQRSEVLRSCEPHHVVGDVEQDPDGEVHLPEEPIWDDFPELDDSSKRGCACEAGPGSTGPMLLLGLGLLGLGLRTRRARRPSAIGGAQ